MLSYRPDITLSTHPPIPRMGKQLIYGLLLFLLTQFAVTSQLGWPIPIPQPPVTTNSITPPVMAFQPPQTAHTLIQFASESATHQDIRQPMLANGRSAVGIAELSATEDTFVTAADNLAILVEKETFAQPMTLEFATHSKTASDTYTQDATTELFHQFGVEIINPETGIIQHEFDHPVRVTIDLREYGIDLEQDGGAFFIAYRNPANPRELIDVPITVYDQAGLIAAEVTHFSDWASGWRPEGWTLHWDLPTAQGFNGAATYSYPIEVPPGRAGLQPAVNLSYSSSAINGAIRTVNSGTVAAGWSLNEIAVVRTGVKVTGVSYATRPETYRLVLNGAGHKLVRKGTDTVAGGTVYVLEDNPSIRAIRFGDDSQDSSIIYWIVQTPDGTSYRLGHGNEDRTRYELHCFCDDQGSNSSRRAKWFDIEWHVDTVTDAYGNMMVYHRDNSTITNRTYDRTFTQTYGSRVTNIYYNFTETVGTFPVAGPFNNMGQLPVHKAGSEVRFEYSPNGDQLTAIETVHDWQDSSTQEKEQGKDATRRHEIKAATFTYENECTRNHDPLHTSTKVVWGITEMSREKGGAWQSLPTQRFEYEAMSNFNKQPFQELWQDWHGEDQGKNKNGNCFNYYRLSRVENGYGGVVEFDYQSDNRNIGEYVDTDGAQLSYPKVGNNWYVSQMRVMDGVGHKTTTHYTRNGACYIQTQNGGQCGNDEDGDERPEWGVLSGFKTVTADVMDFSNSRVLQRTVTHYNQGNLAFGKPSLVESKSPGASGVLQTYQEVVTNYHDSDVNEVTYQPVSTVSTVQYLMGSTSTSITNHEAYTYDTSDNGHGRLTHIVSSINGVAHQTAKTSYLTPKTSNNLFWINRVDKQQVYDKNNIIESSLLSQTTYGYSGQNKDWPIPVSVTAGWGNDTTTSSTEYNDNGTVRATVAPSGNKTTLTYDSQYGLYPVRVNVSGNNSCSFFDIYGFPGTKCNGSSSTEDNSGPLGLLYQVTDPNEVKSKYEYDVHGRLVSSYLPNDHTTPATTITYRDFATPFQIQTDTRSNMAPSVVQYYDGLGRPFMTEQLGVMVESTTQNLLTLTGYDELGQVVRQTAPIETPNNMGDRFYSYQHSSGKFKLAGFRDSFDSSTINTSDWSVPSTASASWGYSTFRMNNGHTELNRTANTQHGLQDQVWGFDFAANNLGDARFTWGIERGTWKGSGANTYRGVFIETNPGTTDFDVLAYQQYQPDIDRQHVFAWQDNFTTKSGDDISKWYHAEIRRSGSTFTFKITQKDDPSVTATKTVNAPAAFATSDWVASFVIQPADPPIGRNADIYLDNYYEYVAGEGITINPAGTSTVYGYSDTHDSLHHPGDMSVVAPDGSKTTTLNTVTSAFNLDGHNRHIQQIITDALGQKTTYVTNPEGQLALVREHNRGGSIYADTKYEYDLQGNLDRVIDAKNNISQMGYDNLGRKTTMNDPDMGNWVYKYDTRGNLTEQFDANGNRLCFYYDTLDRLVHKTKTSESSCPATAVTSGSDWLATYDYDTADKGKGQLAKVSWAPNGALNYETFTYDAFGRANSHTRVIDGQPFTMKTIQFDELNRPTKIEYPDGEQVEMSYDGQGENTLTVDGKVLVSDVRYNERGQMTLLQRAVEGIANTKYSYYGATGTGGDSNFRLKSIDHNFVTHPTYIYSYDLVGNISTLTEEINGKTQVQTFQYDNLYRLERAWTSGSIDNNDPQTYDHSFTYDSLGNIQSRAGLAYKYDGSSTHTVPQPHAVTQVGNDQFFRYDKNGNMTYREISGTVYDQAFDVENRLTEVVVDGSSTTTFYYDPSGQRTMTIAPDGTTTFYPFPVYEEERPGVHEAPTVSLIAGSNQVHLGQNIYLSWTTSGAASCVTSSNWNASSLNGRTTITAPTTAQTISYTLTCENLVGETSDTVSVNVTDLRPEVSLTAPSEAAPNTNFTVSWSSSGASSCKASTVPMMTIQFEATEPDRSSATISSFQQDSRTATISEFSKSRRGVPISNPFSGNKSANGAQKVSLTEGQYTLGITCYNQYGSRGTSRTVIIHPENCARCPGDETHRPGTLYTAEAQPTSPTREQRNWGQAKVASNNSAIIIVRKTYMLAGQPIATKVSGHADGDQNGLFYIFTDHLGSASAIANSQGVVVDTQRFLPFGETRKEATTDITERGFTGHHENRDIGLTYMNARFYVPGVGRFASADTIVPDPMNPQDFNRYSYVRNNPINFTDPTGHISEEDVQDYFGDYDSEDEMSQDWDKELVEIIWSNSFEWGHALTFTTEDGITMEVLLVLVESGVGKYRAGFWAMNGEFEGQEVTSLVKNGHSFNENSSEAEALSELYGGGGGFRSLPMSELSESIYSQTKHTQWTGKGVATTVGTVSTVAGGVLLYGSFVASTGGAGATVINPLMVAGSISTAVGFVSLGVSALPGETNTHRYLLTANCPELGCSHRTHSWQKPVGFYAND